MWRICAVFAAATVVLSGCFPAESLEEIGPLPPGAAIVEARFEEFMQPAAHPLLDASAGTIIDDLELLDGCWGAYIESDASGEFDPKRESRFFRFDVAKGELVHEVILRGAYSLGTLEGDGYDKATTYRFALQSTASGDVKVELITILIATNAPGLKRRSSEIPPNGKEPIHLLVTLDANAFRLESVDDFWFMFGTIGKSYLAFRTACPE